ncbi:MAG: hypothetical protein QXL19_05795 [Ignisphaera sp.]
MNRIKCISNLVVVLGLIMITIVSTIIGFTIVTQYVSQTVKQSPEISASYGKLVFITDTELVDSVIYVTFRGEVGIINPNIPVRGYICIISMNVSRNPTTGLQELEPIELSEYCSTTFTIRSGYNVYSFILRIPRDVLNSLGCQGVYSSCPISRVWYFSIYVQNPRTNIMERALIIKPIYFVPN